MALVDSVSTGISSVGLGFADASSGDADRTDDLHSDPDRAVWRDDVESRFEDEEMERSEMLLKRLATSARKDWVLAPGNLFFRNDILESFFTVRSGALTPGLCAYIGTGMVSGECPPNDAK